MEGFSLFQLVAACCLFILVIKLKPFVNKQINKIASTTFAVYLIHANLLIVPWLWNTVIAGFKFEDSWFVLVYAVISAVMVFVACCLIDLVRQSIFGGLEKRLIGKIINIKIFRRES